MQKIVPCLWFDNQAEEAADFYTSTFKNSKTGRTARYGKEGHEIHGREAGTVMTVEFELDGCKFTALNGGPVFKPTPAISFYVSCDTEKEVDELFRKLSEGGALMPLDTYPFSKRYGWAIDRYGVSWQLNLASTAQKIAPCLMFTGKQHGKAEEAMKLYTSMFPESRIDLIARYEKGEDAPGTIKHAEFTLGGQEFVAMDSGLDHKFTFTEATSLMVKCKDQEELDHYWEKLTEGGDERAQQCGWLKDRYGVSWQVVPEGLEEWTGDPGSESSQRAMAALLKMKKIDIEELKKAYERR